MFHLPDVVSRGNREHGGVYTHRKVWWEHSEGWFHQTLYLKPFTIKFDVFLLELDQSHQTMASVSSIACELTDAHAHAHAHSLYFLATLWQPSYMHFFKYLGCFPSGMVGDAQR